jgi:hypothetical protein
MNATNVNETERQNNRQKHSSSEACEYVRRMRRTRLALWRTDMFKTLTRVALVAALAAGTMTAQTGQAEARRGFGYGIAAGVVAGSVLGAYAYGAPRYYSYSSGPACYKGPRQCDWAGRSCWANRYGERVCSGGEWRCWRPTVCE